jgi:hypothetical protein
LAIVDIELLYFFTIYLTELIRLLSKLYQNLLEGAKENKYYIDLRRENRAQEVIIQVKVFRLHSYCRVMTLEVCTIEIHWGKDVLRSLMSMTIDIISNKIVGSAT